MYEVFFNERRIVITQQGKIPFVKEAVISKKLASVDEVKNWFLDFTSTSTKSAILIHPTPKIFWKKLFLPLFTKIPAAGGIVIRNNQILFILRNGKWDLPKGKIDNGESKKEAALREVSEECGIERHKIIKKLPKTFHIFQSTFEDTLGQWIFKKTFWFEMSYQGEEIGTPQIDENITEIRWFEKSELGEVLQNTYENLRSLILLYKE